MGRVLRASPPALLLHTPISPLPLRLCSFFCFFSLLLTFPSLPSSCPDARMPVSRAGLVHGFGGWYASFWETSDQGGTLALGLKPTCQRPANTQPRSANTASGKHPGTREPQTPWQVRLVQVTVFPWGSCHDSHSDLQRGKMSASVWLQWGLRRLVLTNLIYFEFLRGVVLTYTKEQEQDF